MLCGWLALAAAMGCAGDNRLQPCDIRDSSCQLDVFLAVQDVRGAIWDPWIEPPDMRVISEAQYRAEVIAAHERALQDSGGRDYLTQALKLLLLIDPNESPNAQTDFTVSSVAAYYQPSTHSVTIIDRGGTGNRNAEVQTLAHELVHAAQDRDIGFGRLYQGVSTSDASNALSALLEGEATLYGLLVDAKQIDLPQGRIDWRILSDWSLDVRQRAFTDASPFRLANTEFAYPLGGSYLADVYTAAGPLGVRRLFDDRPRSALRFMAGRGSAEDVVVPAWQCRPPDPPPGYAPISGDELGALNLYAFATRISATASLAWQSALGWTGDRFYIYADPDDDAALAVTWVLRFQSAQAATEFQATLSQSALGLQLRAAREGQAVHVFVSTQALAESYTAWSECQPAD